VRAHFPLSSTLRFITLSWHLAIGALDSGIATFSWLGPVILLVSALLTAGYLLPITVNGFLPGADFDYGNLKKTEK